MPSDREIWTKVEELRVQFPALRADLEWINEHDGRKYEIEREANEFAGRLLVPVESLQQCFNRMQPGFDLLFGRHAWIRDENLRSKAADQIAPQFGVHPKAILTRFNRERVWPSPY